MNLKGGYKIISLMAITLIAGAIDDDRTAITDEGILNQLDSLKEYLDDSKQLKPILLRVKDSGNEVVMANLSKKTGEDIFYINADLVDASLNIMVKFAQDEETLEYYIDEAGYLYIADVDKVAGEVAKAEEGTIVDTLGLDEDGGLVKGIIPNVENAEDGTIVDVLGLDGNGKLVKGTISGGTKLYKHTLTLSGLGFKLEVISNTNVNFFDSSNWGNLNILSLSLIQVGPTQPPTRYAFVGTFANTHTIYLYSYTDSTNLDCNITGDTVTEL